MNLLRLNKKKDLGHFAKSYPIKDTTRQSCKVGLQEYFCEKVLLCFGSQNIF